MSTTTRTAQDYLVQLRAALADLPPGEVEDILGDVEVQLRESDDVELARLGPAQAYAAELRAAAGYPAAPVSPHRRGSAVRARLGIALLLVACVAGLLVGWVSLRAVSGVAVAVSMLLVVGVPAALGWALVRGGTGLRAVPEVAAALAARDRLVAALPEPVVTLVVSLRPAWWVLRAGLAALLAFSVLRIGSQTALLAVGLAFVAPSVWLGRRAQHHRGAGWTSAPLDLLAVGVLLAVPAFLSGYGLGAVAPQAQVVYQDVPGNLAVSNIYPFDANGKPLSGVYLFDQDGKPLEVWEYTCYDGTYENQPGVDQENPANRFPLPHVVRDDATGSCVVQQARPFTVAIPATSTTPGATTSPGATTTTTTPTPSTAPSPSSGVGSAAPTG